YYLGEKGSLFGQLNAGCRLAMLDEDPDFLFNMPYLCHSILRDAIYDIRTREDGIANKIRTSMQSLIVEAHIKYIHAKMECGSCVSELFKEIEWITTNFPNHQRWQRLVSKTEALSKVFI